MISKKDLDSIFIYLSPLHHLGLVHKGRRFSWNDGRKLKYTKVALPACIRLSRTAIVPDVTKWTHLSVVITLPWLPSWKDFIDLSHYVKAWFVLFRVKAWPSMQRYVDLTTLRMEALFKLFEIYLVEQCGQMSISVLHLWASWGSLSWGD